MPPSSFRHSTKNQGTLRKVCDAIPQDGWITFVELRRALPDIKLGTLKGILNRSVERGLVRSAMKSKRYMTHAKRGVGEIRKYQRTKKALNDNPQPQKEKRKLKPVQALYIMRNPDKLSHGQLARIFGLSRQHVGAIINRDERRGGWAHLDDPRYKAIPDKTLRERARPERYTGTARFFENFENRA